MSVPSQLPDGNSNVQICSDDEEEMQPAYFRAALSRSHSRCVKPAAADGDEKGDSTSATAALNENVLDGAAAQLPLREAKNDLDTGQSGRPRPPTVAPDKVASPPTPAGSLPGKITKPAPLRKSDELASWAETDCFYQTTVKNPSVRLPPPPPPPAASSLGFKMSTSTEPPAPKRVSSPPAPTGSGAKTHFKSTARTFSSKSRMDALLEKNPSPPRLPRRAIVRVFGPKGPPPGYEKQDDSKKDAQEPPASSKRNYGPEKPKYHPGSPDYVRYFPGTPRYCAGSPDYENSRSCSGGVEKTPHVRKGFYRVRTPYFQPRTPLFDYASSHRRNTGQVASSPYYVANASGNAGRCLSFQAPFYVPSTPYYMPRYSTRKHPSVKESSHAALHHSTSSSSKRTSRALNSCSNGRDVKTAHVGRAPLRKQETKRIEAPCPPSSEHHKEEAADPLCLDNSAHTPPPPGHAAFQQNSIPSCPGKLPTSVPPPSAAFPCAQEFAVSPSPPPSDPQTSPMKEMPSSKLDKITANTAESTIKKALHVMTASSSPQCENGFASRGGTLPIEDSTALLSKPIGNGVKGKRRFCSHDCSDSD